MSDTVEHEAEAAPLSTSEDIRADLLASMEAKTPTEQPAETTEPEAPEGETEAQRDERLRDERGRFAKAPEATEQPEEAAPETPAEAPKAIEPPATWPEEQKAQFAKVPPELQAFLVKRHQETEADYTRKTSQVAALRRDFEPVAQMFEPHREAMRAKGFTPASLIRGYIETEGGLMNQQTAPNVAAQIIRAYNIPPDAVMRALGWQPPAAQAVAEGETAAPEPQQPALPPQVMDMLNGVVQRVQTWEQRQEQERAWQLEQAQSRVMSEIERFKNEAGTDGRPLRPYFAEVEDDMAELAQLAVKKGGDTPPLQELYDTAVWANPNTRNRLLAEQTAAQEAQRRAQEAKARDEARAKAARAQKASAPVSGAPRTGHAAAANGTASIRDDLREAIDLHS